MPVQDLPGAEGPTLFVSRTGKPPGLHLQPSDFVQVVSFDKAEWKAVYRSAHPDYRPTSDTPLLQVWSADWQQAGLSPAQ